jgi:2-succinyl-5-enolpyruvyl-6-hydroxy-3-cyclohexene-1-carboxylate synthase
MEEMQKGIDRLLAADALKPMLLEVFTDASDDEHAWRDYFAFLKQGD